MEKICVINPFKWNFNHQLGINPWAISLLKLKRNIQTLLDLEIILNYPIDKNKSNKYSKKRIFSTDHSSDGDQMLQSSIYDCNIGKCDFCIDACSDLHIRGTLKLAHGSSIHTDWRGQLHDVCVINSYCSSYFLFTICISPFYNNILLLLCGLSDNQSIPTLLTCDIIKMICKICISHCLDTSSKIIL